MDKINAARLNEQLEKLPAVEVLKAVASGFPGNVTFSTSLGAEDQVLTHMVSSIGLDVSIFTLDTGRMFQETYDLLERTNQLYGIQIGVKFPDSPEVEEMVNHYGINLFYESIEKRKQCCAIRKLHPLKQALSGKEIWITGIRREQSVTRYNAAMAEWDEQHGICKVNPLRDWDETMVWDYIHRFNVPYNVLHDKGYPSIGCAPCTRAVKSGEDVRAGRWWWENAEHKECGLHPGDRK